MLLEQLVFLLPLQQVLLAFFGHVVSQTFPVFTHTSLPSSFSVNGHSLELFSMLTSSLDTVFSTAVLVCAFTLVIPIKNTANNMIDNYCILNNFKFIYGKYSKILNYFAKKLQ